MDDYIPGSTFRVYDRLPAPTTVELLHLPDGKTLPVLERPDEYAGYTVRSEAGGRQVRSTSIVFTREALDVDGTYEFLADARVFSERLKLLQATVRAIGASLPPDDDGS